MNQLWRGILPGVVLAGLVMLGSSCVGLPPGTQSVAHVGKLQLAATGAGLVGADTEKTRFRIKCGRCGFEPEEFIVDTPSVGRPYLSNWGCRKCGKRQAILIEASGL